MDLKTKPSFVIDRTKWLRGDPHSYLLRFSDKKMCCLGQICTQLGISNRAIIRAQTPGDIRSKQARKLLMGFLLEGSPSNEFITHLANQAMQINDRIYIEKIDQNSPDYRCLYKDEDREAELIKLFAKEGYELTFIN